jgi:hypothetical protein
MEQDAPERMNTNMRKMIEGRELDLCQRRSATTLQNM